MDEAENPASTIFKSDWAAPAKARQFTVPPAAPVESNDPRESRMPASLSIPPAPKMLKPPASETHRFQGEVDGDFHSDI
jgi:hypothetical protein